MIFLLIFLPGCNNVGCEFNEGEKLKIHQDIDIMIVKEVIKVHGICRYFVKSENQLTGGMWIDETWWNHWDQIKKVE